MWKLILGVVGLVCGLPVGVVVSSVLADFFKINWFHGDSRGNWLLAAAVLSVAIIGAAGFRLGMSLDQSAANRHRRESGG